MPGTLLVSMLRSPARISRKRARAKRRHFQDLAPVACGRSRPIGKNDPAGNAGTMRKRRGSPGFSPWPGACVAGGRKIRVAGDQVLPAAIVIAPLNGPVATTTPAAPSPGRSSQDFQQVLQSLGNAPLPADTPVAPPAVTADRTGRSLLPDD